MSELNLEGESLALQLTRLGIVEQILGVRQDFQQQALDLLILLLGQGLLKFSCRCVDSPLSHQICVCK